MAIMFVKCYKCKALSFIGDAFPPVFGNTPVFGSVVTKKRFFLCQTQPAGQDHVQFILHFFLSLDRVCRRLERLEEEDRPNILPRVANAEPRQANYRLHCVVGLIFQNYNTYI